MNDADHRGRSDSSLWPVELALQPGQLGVVMARAGGGKSGALVGLGLDRANRGEATLHVGLGGSLTALETGYSLQLDERLAGLDPVSRAQRQAELARRRLLVALPEPLDCAEPIDRSLRTAREGMGLEPGAILVDGFAWSGKAEAVRRQLVALRDVAEGHDASLWMTVRTRRRTGDHPDSMPRACAPFADQIDLGVFLEPRGGGVELRVLHDRRDRADGDAGAVGTRRHRRRAPRRTAAMSAAGVTLVSGGAAGAEAEFGTCAEGWGLAERTLSFAGRRLKRRRGLVELSEDELLRGDVSRTWLTARMNRNYDPSARFQKLLQTLWHQVTDAREVFAVGSIQADGTVRGGTGWAVELARLWGKPVHVFDQPTAAWFAWDGERWSEAVEAPVITAARFCGTGTRHLDDRGRRAIRELFRRSFAGEETSGGEAPPEEEDHDA